MSLIDSEIFDIANVRIRLLDPVPAVKPFEDSTMGPFKTFSLCIITVTDTDGYIGEAPVYSSCLHIYEKCMFPILFHNNGLTYKELYFKMYWSIRNEGFRGHAAALLGQLDTVLHDLAARRKGMPIHRFLGAKRDYAKVYGSGAGTNYTYRELEEEITYFLDCGFDCVKMKVGKGFGTRMKEDIERVKFVRQLIGKEVLLAVDVNQIWSVSDALDFLSAVHGENIAWLEEPVHSASLREIELLCKESPVNIAFGESERSGKVFPSLINAGVRHLQPAPIHLCGIEEWMEVSELACDFRIDFSSGGYPLYTASLIATRSENFQVEYLYTLMANLNPYFAVSPELLNGRFIIPDIEGFPVRIDWKYWERRGKVIMDKSWTAKDTVAYCPVTSL